MLTQLETGHSLYQLQGYWASGIQGEGEGLGARGGVRDSMGWGNRILDGCSFKDRSTKVHQLRYLWMVEEH